MFAFLKGTVIFIKKDYVALDVGGVGYKVFTPNPYEFAIGDSRQVFTHQIVSENDIALYGFKTMNECDLFIQLISARGIGARTACAILATKDMQGLADAITNGDAKYLCKFPKIGPKTASQIILDLQGKLEATGPTLAKNNQVTEAIEALEALGYNSKELARVKKEFESSDASVDEIIKKGLQLLVK